MCSNSPVSFVITSFPAEEHWFSMNGDELKKLREQIGS